MAACDNAKKLKNVFTTARPKKGVPVVSMFNIKLHWNTPDLILMHSLIKQITYVPFQIIFNLFFKPV